MVSKTQEYIVSMNGRNAHYHLNVFVIGLWKKKLHENLLQENSVILKQKE